MQQMMSFLVVGVFALGVQSAIAGGLPVTKSADATSAGSGTTQASATTSTNSAANDTSASSSSNNATGSNTTSTETDATATQSAEAAAGDETENGAVFVAIEDDPLIVDASAIMDDDGMGNVQVQWQISKDGETWMNLTGAVHQSFTPREAHVGQRLRVQISYVDGQGNLETLTSPPSTKVQNVNDKPIGSPQLAGNAREEDALVVDVSLIADEDGVGIYAIIWQRSSTKTEWQAFPESVGEVLQLTQAHVGYSYRAVVSYVDSHGTRELLITNPSETVVNVDDPVQGEVLLAGEASEGEVLTANTARVSDEDGIASMTVGWESSKDGRTWRAIETGGASQLRLSQALVDRQVRARVSVVDTFGIETVIFSQATNTVKNVNNKPAGTIFVKRVGG
ncbi:hypothetical protein [Candidatus Puniceispirillum sp.]|uniref:hypothetical protein n=1 Tax=Candidatus Puniceispirillum sp. TaxID=2026719 RepID=UPI001EC6F161|nr:hypothetical protein [Candidatus Puniceispirillum sp.]